ncbi:MAG: TatD family hydrolase [Victivallaceae bacterium]
MKYINFHAHRPEVSPDAAAVVCFEPEKPFPPVPSGQFSACGIHPWSLKNLSGKEIEEQLAVLDSLTSSGCLCAIGETGLDRLNEPELELQSAVFRKHITLAEKYSLPLIIHCVRRYPELISIKNQSGDSVPWMIHGFNSNDRQLEQLLKHGCFISFGPSAIRKANANDSLLKSVPLSRLCLETDDSPDNIKDIYQQAAAILNIDEPALLEIMNRNFESIFKKTP